MPNWRKVITSGSDAALNSLNVISSITSSGDLKLEGSIYDNLNQPGISGQLLSVSGSTVKWVDSLVDTASLSLGVEYDNVFNKPTLISSSLQFNTISSPFTGSFTGSFTGDGSGLTGVTIEQFTTLTSSFTNQSSLTVTHNLDSENINVVVYDNTKTQFIPDTIQIIDPNTVNIEFAIPTTGHVVVTRGGHILSGSIDGSQITGEVSLSGSFSGSFQGDGSNLTGTLTLPDFTYRTTITGGSSYTINHGLDEEYPIVQVYDTTTKKQVIPSDIESIDINNISLTFESITNGRVVVKK